MQLDANKTGLTHRVTAVAAAYLDGLGCKPVETEVEVAPGWVADVASYWYPTRTELKRLRLHKAAQGLLLTVAVEVKTTRPDFLSDRKRKLPPPANICLLAYPHGTLSPDEIPDGWHGLETSKDGRKLWHLITCHYCAYPQHMAQTLNFVAQVGIRRDYRTRHRALVDCRRAYNANEGEKVKRYSAARLLDGLASWIRAEGCWADQPLRELLRDLGVKNLPKYADKAVCFFESLRSNGDTNDAA